MSFFDKRVIAPLPDMRAEQEQTATSKPVPVPTPDHTWEQFKTNINANLLAAANTFRLQALLALQDGVLTEATQQYVYEAALAVASTFRKDTKR